MKIYVTKSTPWDYTFAGADRCKVWFSKPYLTQNMFSCPVFGLLNPQDFQYSRWDSDNGFSLKVLRKQQSELFLTIWKDIQATYHDPEYNAISEGYDQARKDFNHLYKMPKYLNPNSTKLSRVIEAHTDLKKTIFCEKAVEKVSWREWIGEYDINIIMQ